MARPVHSMIRVLDADRSIDFYSRAFGMKEVDRFTFDDFSLIFLTGDDCEFELELTVNHGQTEPYTHGTGYGHFAVSTDDIHAHHAKCAEAGLDPTPVKDLICEGKLAVRFFFVTDPDGYKVEIVQRQGRYL